jgi:hypothetical protein
MRAFASIGWEGAGSSSLLVMSSLWPVLELLRETVQNRDSCASFE